MLRKLVERRSRRGWWAHLIWGFCYSLFILVMLGSFGAQSWSDVIRAWPLFIPLGFVVVQWLRPTLLGWGVVSLPGAVYPIAVIVGLLADSFGPSPLWRTWSLFEFVGGFVFLGIMTVIVVALVRASWPRELARSAS